MVYNEESLISVVFRDQSIQCFRDYIMMGLLTYLLTYAVVGDR